MTTSRLEAFSDGVLAIIITIMVLELRVPEGHDFHALWESTGLQLLTYILSFAYIGIYWNNHHHLFQLTERITGVVLWANLHLLFWLSLLPFTTAWMDESRLSSVPVLVYGVNLLAAAVAFVVLQRSILRAEGNSSRLRRVLGRDAKGRASVALYAAGILSAWLTVERYSTAGVILALGCFVLVALLWFVPDRRIERDVTSLDHHGADSP